MTPEFWAIIGVGAVVVGSHWSLHRDIDGVRRDQHPDRQHPAREPQAMTLEFLAIYGQ